MNELKPCPFCGGTAKLEAFYDIKNRHWDVAVECQECPAAIWIYEYPDRDVAEMYASEMWDRRNV